MTSTRIILSFILLLSGCSGPGYFEPIEPEAGAQAVLYIYRPKADNPGVQPLRFYYPDLLINGESIGVLHFNRYRMVRLDAGEYTLKATGLTEIAKWAPKDRDLAFKLEPGEVRFIKLNIRFNETTVSVGEPKDKHLIFLTPMDAQAARYEIRDTSDEADWPR